MNQWVSGTSAGFYRSRVRLSAMCEKGKENGAFFLGGSDCLIVCLLYYYSYDEGSSASLSFLGLVFCRFD